MWWLTKRNIQEICVAWTDTVFLTVRGELVELSAALDKLNANGFNLRFLK